jgi:hypothetical protein
LAPVLRPATSKRSALTAVVGALAALAALSGCGGGGQDNGALAPGSVPPGQAAVLPQHGNLPVSQGSVGDVRYPVVRGTAHAAQLDAALLAKARTLTSKGVACAVSTLRADTALVSFQWTCAGKAGLTATYRTATAAPLTLGDLFTGDYLRQLSTTAVTQLELGGASPAAARAAAPPTAAAFAEWGLDDTTLMVTFTAGSSPVTISFPLASLTSLISPTGPLGHG